MSNTPVELTLCPRCKKHGMLVTSEICGFCRDELNGEAGKRKIPWRNRHPCDHRRPYSMCEIKAICPYKPKKVNQCKYFSERVIKRRKRRNTA